MNAGQWKFFKMPLRLVVDAQNNETVQDADGHSVATFWNPGHEPEETENADAETDRFRALVISGANAALSAPDQEATYEGDTAKGWYEAWNRENDAWQALAVHHEAVEALAVQLCRMVTGEGVLHMPPEMVQVATELRVETAKGNAVLDKQRGEVASLRKKLEAWQNWNASGRQIPGWRILRELGEVE